MGAWRGFLNIGLLLGFGLLSCNRPSPLKGEPELAPGRMSSTDKNVLIPKKLIQDLEKDYLKTYKLNFPDSELKDGEVLARIPRRTLKLKVALASASPEVLVSSSSFEVGRGGGVLDLAEWVSGIRGDFHLGIRVAADEGVEAKNLKVYFVSHAPRIEIDGKNWGLGCGKYAEITSFYDKVMRKEGIRLNSTNTRYLYAVSGTYLFAFTEGENLHVSTVSVTDSRYGDKLCDLQVTQSSDEDT